jgi:DNA-binding transcriptional LysR family regulator
LIERARLLVNQARDIEQDLKQMLGLEVGLLRIGAGPYPADLSVGTAIGRFVQRHPALMVDLSVADWSELIRRVASGELELAIADTGVAQHDDRLVVESLPRHKLGFFCRSGHPLAGSAALTLEELRKYPLVGTALPPQLSALAAKDRKGMRANLPAGVSGTGDSRRYFRPGATDRHAERRRRRRRAEPDPVTRWRVESWRCCRSS